MLNNQHVTAENWGDDLIAWLLNKLVRLDPTIPPTSLQTYIAYVLCARGECLCVAQPKLTVILQSAACSCSAYNSSSSSPVS
jgi:hypothetical protein